LNAGGKELKSVSTYDWQPRESKSFLPNKVGFVKNRRARLEDIKDPISKIARTWALSPMHGQAPRFVQFPMLLYHMDGTAAWGILGP
jgi:hypothetical protein